MSATRLVMVIDHLEAGGAQRQFCLLATSLRSLGFVIKVIVFRPDDFFGESLQKAGPISVVSLVPRNRMHLIYQVRSEIRRELPHVVIAFLSWPNMLVELAGFPRRKFAVVVSERNLDMSPAGPRRSLRYFLHRFADVIVSNSYAQKERVDQLAPYLSSRTLVIVNGVDTLYFRPSDRVETDPAKVRVLVLARFAPQKNVLRFVEAVHLFRVEHPDVELDVDWYGKRTAIDRKGARRADREAAAYYGSVEYAINEHMMQDSFGVHDPRKDVRRLYAGADAVCLPSLHEGCSNVIGEAMACGVPVLASRVSDNVRLVEEGRNGFLFDPLSVDDMSDTMYRFATMGSIERRPDGA